MPKQNVPALRLDGFSDEWKTGHFGDAGRELVGYPFESSEFSKDGVKLVRGMNIKRGFLDFNARINMRWPSTEGVEDYLLEEDDIVIAMDGLVGTSFAKIETCHLPALLVQRVFRMRPESADPSFVYQSIAKGFALHAQLLRTSTTIAHLTSRDISAFPVSYPPTLEEQQAIGAIFTNLDAAINQHTLKHKALQQSKTALMQRMFPQGGQTVPELRLEGFDGEWVETSMASIASFNKGTGYSKNDFRETGTPLFHYGRLYTNYQLAVTDVDTYAQLRPGSVLSRGDEVLIPSSGETAEDIATACALLQEGVILGGDLNIVRPTPGYDNVFLALSLSQGAAKAKLERKAQGKTVVHIHNSDIRALDVAFPPTLEEQQAIGAVFTNLDQLIAAEAQYIVSLKQAKSALLQRMFI